MGLFANTAKQIKQENEGKFRPLELNEVNVRAIFTRCGKENEDGSTAWNKEKLAQNKAYIRYLLGQLALVHDGVTEHELNADFLKRYDGKVWTGDGSVLIRLLNMGGKSDFCSFYEKDEKQFLKLRLYTLKPTCSPKDPAFPAWWETPAALVIQAKAAAENGNAADALSLYEKAAEQGNADAQYKCGVMYFEGKGTAVDKTKALMWYEKAARQGHAKAQVRCGIMYDDGEGTAADKARALMWFEKAAEQGDAFAQLSCGSMYYNGEGTVVDMTKALMWYEKAAEQGDIAAQFRCGVMYDEGEGTAVDKTKALMWYEKAAAHKE